MHVVETIRNIVCMYVCVWGGGFFSSLFALQEIFVPSPSPSLLEWSIPETVQIDIPQSLKVSDHQYDTQNMSLYNWSVAPSKFVASWVPAKRRCGK